MAYVFKNIDGLITAVSESENFGDGWLLVADDDKTYLAFLEQTLAKNASFRESDIQLARVLEDLITILIDGNVIRFTDFPAAAQKRLNDRQSMRKKTQLSKLMDNNTDKFF